ncbi:MAG TPA: hypothetical protein VHN39_18275 [Phenylobacterium sp.]|jgi:hypothetical protein|nr:hypothetical protein [Phenylobacterium sp.]
MAERLHGGDADVVFQRVDETPSVPARGIAQQTVLQDDERT